MYLLGAVAVLAALTSATPLRSSPFSSNTSAFSFPPLTPIPTLIQRNHIPGVGTYATVYPIPTAPVPNLANNPSAPASWSDPYGGIAKGFFSFEVESGLLSIFVQGFGPLTFLPMTFRFCDWGVSQTILGKTDMIDANTRNLLGGTLYIHGGDQCADPLTTTWAQAFDNVYVIWNGEVINLPEDTRCGDVAGKDWARARRCIIKLGTGASTPTVTGFPQKSLIAEKPTPKHKLTGAMPAWMGGGKSSKAPAPAPAPSQAPSKAPAPAPPPAPKAPAPPQAASKAPVPSKAAAPAPSKAPAPAPAPSKAAPAPAPADHCIPPLCTPVH